uniref:Uncharacterized protein n=1 Tax=Parascaris univalens TaxID=6257 RepID=A0A915A568_PARUN
HLTSVFPEAVPHCITSPSLFIAVQLQFSSSEESPQSLIPLHTEALGMHLLFLHVKATSKSQSEHLS